MTAWARDWPVLLTTLGAAGAARVAMGVKSYPYGDDLVYGPLARLAVDPTLYPGDAVLRAFANHAWLYTWAWRAGAATIGVAPLFLILTLAISAATALGLLAVMRAAGARGALAPLALMLAVVATARGVGRGDYGGAFTDHFHLQGVAIAIALFAFAALLRGEAVKCGVLLGLGALAHPALTLHAAFAVGCGWIALGRAGIRPLLVTAAVTALIAAPVNLPLALSAAHEPLAAPMEEVIRKGFLFRAAHHYLIPVGPLALLAAYLGLGFIGARALGNRAALGLMAGFAALGALIALLYSADFDLGLRYRSYAIYILDFTRSTPLVWVLGPALAFAALERSEDRSLATKAVIAGPAAGLLLANYQWSPAGIGALGFAVAAAAALRVRRAPAVIGLAGAALAAVVALRTETPRPAEEIFRPINEWIRTETPPDAMFIAPHHYSNLREYTLRSRWADFRAMSMAQPAQVWLARRRLEQVTPGFEEAGDVGGWAAMDLWQWLYMKNNTPDRIAGHLRDKADYFIGLTAAGFSDQEIRAAGLERVYADRSFEVFRLRAHD